MNVWRQSRRRHNTKPGSNIACPAGMRQSIASRGTNAGPTLLARHPQPPAALRRPLPRLGRLLLRIARRSALRRRPAPAGAPAGAGELRVLELERGERVAERLQRLLALA